MRIARSVSKSDYRCHPAKHSCTCGAPRAFRARSSKTRPPLLATLVAVLCASTPLRAAILPTEVYYNGPSPGADPDEFLELSNTGLTAISLQGFRFSLGIDLLLPDITLAPLSSLIIAPNPLGFRASFPSFTGAVLDTRGSLSNSGEIIELLDAAGDIAFSLSYDDTGSWPRSADGDGDSLQLLDLGLALNEASSWFGATPDPGFWVGFDLPDDADPGETNAIPVPGTLALILASLAGWAGTRPHGARQRRRAPRPNSETID